MVGASLRDCISTDPSVWVVAVALDGLYDVFGSDDCPPELFTSLQIMPALQNISAQFTARVSEFLCDSYAEIVC